MTTVCFVGAGSAVFTRQLLRDLLSFDDLGSVTLVMHDIDPRRLELAEGLAHIAATRHAQPGRTVTVRAEADRRTALAGADFVINSVNVGGHAATVTDFEIPARYGVRQTIADTLGGRRGVPRPAHLRLPGRAGHGHRRRLSGCLAAQLHQPDGDEHPVPRHRAPRGQGARPVPLGVLDRPRPVPAGRRAAGGGALPQRRRQPPGLAAGVGARRAQPLPVARRADRGRPGAAPPGARRHVPPARLLPDRDQRALQRVRRVVPARGRRDRTAAHPGR